MGGVVSVGAWGGLWLRRAPGASSGCAVGCQQICENMRSDVDKHPSGTAAAERQTTAAGIWLSHERPRGARQRDKPMDEPTLPPFGGWLDGPDLTPTSTCWCYGPAEDQQFCTWGRPGDSHLEAPTGSPRRVLFSWSTPFPITN